MGHILLSRQIGGCGFISGVKMGVSPAVLEIEARHGLLDLGSLCHRREANFFSTPVCEPGRQLKFYFYKRAAGRPIRMQVSRPPPPTDPRLPKKSGGSYNHPRPQHRVLLPRRRPLLLDQKALVPFGADY